MKPLSLSTSNGGVKTLFIILATNKLKLSHIWEPPVHKDVKYIYYFNEEMETKKVLEKKKETKK